MAMPDNMKKRAVLDIRNRRVLCPALFMVAMAFISLALPLSVNAGGSSIVPMDAEADNPSTVTLTIDKTCIDFLANPGTFPTIPASQGPVSVTANATIDAGSTATLTVVAGGDLVSGNNIIPIDKVSWTATGDGFVPGPTMIKKTSATAGNWQGPGEYHGTFSFFLANSWSYATGTYSQTVTYTLSAP